MWHTMPVRMPIRGVSCIYNKLILPVSPILAVVHKNIYINGFIFNKKRLQSKLRWRPCVWVSTRSTTSPFLGTIGKHYSHGYPPLYLRHYVRTYSVIYIMLYRFEASMPQFSHGPVSSSNIQKKGSIFLCTPG